MMASPQNLEDVIGFCDGAEKVGLVMVVAGLILEVALAINNPPYGSFVERFGPVIADGLVAAGVVLEYLAGLRASLCQGEQLRRSSERLGFAERDAADALERAAGLELEAAHIRKAAAWRELSPEQRRRLVAALSPISAGIQLAYPFNDPEATEYCAAFYNVFRQAGWQIQLASRTFLGPPVGIFVASGNSWSEDIEVEIKRMREIFRDAGIPVEKGAGAVEVPDSGRTIGIAAARVRVIIGHKPPPQLG